MRRTWSLRSETLSLYSNFLIISAFATGVQAYDISITLLLNPPPVRRTWSLRSETLSSRAQPVKGSWAGGYMFVYPYIIIYCCIQVGKGYVLLIAMGDKNGTWAA